MPRRTPNRVRSIISAGAAVITGRGWLVGCGPDPTSRIRPHYVRDVGAYRYEPPISPPVEIWYTPTQSEPLAATPAHHLRFNGGPLRLRVSVQRFGSTTPNAALVVFHCLFVDERGRAWSHTSAIPDREFLPWGAQFTRLDRAPPTGASVWHTIIMPKPSAEEETQFDLGSQFGHAGLDVSQTFGGVTLLPEGVQVELSVYANAQSPREVYSYRYVLPYERFLFRPGPGVEDGVVTPFGSELIIYYGADSKNIDLPRSPIDVLDERGKRAAPASTAAWDGLPRIRDTLSPPRPPPPPKPPVPRDVPGPEMPAIVNASEPKRIAYTVAENVDLPAIHRVVRLQKGRHTGVLRLGKVISVGDEWDIAIFDFLDESGDAWRHWSVFRGEYALFPFEGCIVTILPPEERTDEALDAAGPWDMRSSHYVDGRDDVVIPVSGGEPIKLRLKYTGYHARARLESDRVRIRASLHAPEDPREMMSFIPIEFTKPVDTFLWHRGPRRHDHDDWGADEVVLLEPLVGEDAAALRGTPRSPARIEDIGDQ